MRDNDFGTAIYGLTSIKPLFLVNPERMGCWTSLVQIPVYEFKRVASVEGGLTMRSMSYLSSNFKEALLSTCDQDGDIFVTFDEVTFLGRRLVFRINRPTVVPDRVCWRIAGVSGWSSGANTLRRTFSVEGGKGLEVYVSTEFNGGFPKIQSRITFGDYDPRTNNLEKVIFPNKMTIAEMQEVIEKISYCRTSVID